MKRVGISALAALIVVGYTQSLKADAEAVVKKAIAAMGGEEKLGKIKAAMWKSKGTMSFGENSSPFTSQVTVDGVSNYSLSFDGKFGENDFKITVVLSGDKAWRKFGDMSQELAGDELASEKRTAYLAWAPLAPVVLLGKDYKLKADADEKVDGKAVAVVTVTPPDKKDFKLYFDKESSLPVKLVAKVRGFMGDEVDQEILYSGFKDFGGIKRATKTVHSMNGNKFLEQEVTEFKLLDKVDAKTFQQPD